MKHENMKHEEQGVPSPHVSCFMFSLLASLKPDGPRSDSRRHRVGLVRLLFPGVTCRNTLEPSLTLPDLWSRADAFRQVAPGLGPPRPAQHDLPLARSIAQTVLRESFSRPLTQMGWRSGFPTGRPWDFALDRINPSDPHVSGLGPTRTTRPFRCDLPDPFLGSRTLDRTSVRHWGPLGPTLRTTKDSLLRGDSVAANQTFRRDPQLPRVTGGDSNPTCLWALASPLVPGGLRRRSCDRSSRGSLPCRWPPASALPALVCFAGPSLLGKPDSVLGAVLLFRRPLSCPTTKGNIRSNRRITKEFRVRTFWLSTGARKHLTVLVLTGA